MGIDPSRKKRWDESMNQLCLDGFLDSRKNEEGEDMFCLTTDGEIVARAMLEQFGLEGKKDIPYDEWNCISM